MFSRLKILFLVSSLFVALLNSIPTYLLNFKFFIILVDIACKRILWCARVNRMTRQIHVQRARPESATLLNVSG